MKVLLLGATGFVGSAVLRAVLERPNTEVWCLCRPGATLDATSRVHRLAGDVTDEESICRAVAHSQCDVCINLAAVYAWWGDHATFDAVNTAGAANVARATGLAVKLVHVSTVLAYGRPEGLGGSPETAFDEAAAPGPHTSYYATSKCAGDAAVQALFDTRVATGCTCFLACCVGADPRLLDPVRDVMRIADLVSGAVPATIASDVTFTYVHVRDAAEAIVRAAEKSGNSGERYFVGDQRLTTRDFYSMIAELSGQPPPAREIPAWLAMGAARAMTFAAWLTGVPPKAPLDLVRTATAGNLCFSALKSVEQLGMSYTPIRAAFTEAVDFITNGKSG